jgi:hypothetical protein
MLLPFKERKTFRKFSILPVFPCKDFSIFQPANSRFAGGELTRVSIKPILS